MNNTFHKEQIADMKFHLHYTGLHSYYAMMYFINIPKAKIFSRTVNGNQIFSIHWNSEGIKYQTIIKDKWFRKHVINHINPEMSY